MDEGFSLALTTLLLLYSLYSVVQVGSGTTFQLSVSPAHVNEYGAVTLSYVKGNGLGDFD